ncbi:CYTH domain-containing protein [Falsibacillus pallidus]|uniref:Adenylate cyclase n=1 Tax=Falsibacillus pallidus TaxID=493781 RepID=A0A370GVP8_9BACI|nr:CYTH domain-containing protein [Falsibacillus pallidus]RDI47755.1 adenylate cyclase [Falsibacillus pallidus]
MSKEIEIEFKNLLSKKEFESLKKSFGIEDRSFTSQVNHYFDSEDFKLKELGSALRIRMKNDKAVLTLKEPAEVGLLETHQPVEAEEVDSYLKGHAFPPGEVVDRLTELSIDMDCLSYFGTLQTNRAEADYKGGLLVLDHSSYLNFEDYEIEYEVKDFQSGKNLFNQLLEEHRIPIRETENKIKRFYLAKFNS